MIFDWPNFTDLFGIPDLFYSTDFSDVSGQISTFVDLVNSTHILGFVHAVGVAIHRVVAADSTIEWSFWYPFILIKIVNICDISFSL